MGFFICTFYARNNFTMNLLFKHELQAYKDPHKHHVPAILIKPTLIIATVSSTRNGQYH